jgi:hypothetical protein
MFLVQLRIAENPGMGQAGVYYYYNTFAKALDAPRRGRVR